MPVSGTSDNPIHVVEHGRSQEAGAYGDVIPVPDSSSENEDYEDTVVMMVPRSAAKPFPTATPIGTAPAVATHRKDLTSTSLVEKKKKSCSDKVQ